MKGEILRRLSLEIVKDEGVIRDDPAKQDVEKEKEDGEDYLVKTIGAFGLWQGVVSVTVALNRVIAIWNMLSLSFLTPIVEFVCVEFSDHVTIEVNNSTCYDNCVRYKYSSIIGRSIIEDFGLICHDNWLGSFTQSVLMFGVLVGVSIFGWISDRFGRRTALLSSNFLNAVFMIALPFSSTYIIFTSIRFVIGIATGGAMVSCVVMVMEIIGKWEREVAAACILIPEGLAQASLAGFAYFTTNWQSYTLSLGVATCFIFVLMLFVPESPRWLLSSGKVDEAMKVITRAAERNKFDTSNIKAELAKALEDMKLKDREIVKTSYLDFFKSKAIFILSISAFMIWFAMGMSFYGINQYVTVVGVDPYLTVVILGLTQIPISPVGIILNRRVGRKISSIGTLIGIAATMLIEMFMPKGSWLVTLFTVLALASSNMAFIVSYLYVSELYPTPLRNMGYGLTSGGAKTGAMLAPFVASLTPIWLPSLMFSIFAVIGALCCFFLPETKGQNLKDTLEKY